MKIYSNILIDADDTIFDFGKCERNAFFKSAERIGIEADDSIYNLYSMININLWKAHERKEISREDIQNRRFTDLLRRIGKDESKGLKWNEEYVKELALQSCVFEESEEACRKLSEKYKLYIITNGIAFIQHSRIDSIPFSDVFSGVFISGEIGYAKPDVKFFEKAIEKIPDFKKDNSVVVGDSLTSDIAGANNFGLDAILIDRKNEHPEKSDLYIAKFKNLNELCDYLL